MSPEEIKIIIFRKKFTIAGLARSYKKETGKSCSREAMSQCIRQVEYRTYQDMRDWLERKLDEPNLWRTGSTAAWGTRKKSRKAA